ncbi:response regulator [Geomesophilobacter sediminis]|uniref:Response regulator n=1 Tax=Geomesophilobacter sediminis TaxID=2798584 RepID=A0A8J7J0Y6_9BACT|nr:response regulator [Geomesophilobacter sediminis]MBJ6724183.1 response regulator [Geomesophilobacter sediminis]
MARDEVRVEILLVEDNEADVNIIRKTFEESKIANNVNVVNHGEDALDFMRRRGRYAGAPRPDLVLLDIGLPGISGLDVLGEVKGDPDLRRIPIIMLTTSKTEEDLFDSYDLHANSYITKPFHLNALFEVVREIEQFWFGTVKLPPR